MSNVAYPLCPHKQNPAACLTCFHARARAPKPASAQRPFLGSMPVPAGVLPGKQDAAPPERRVERGPQAIVPRPAAPKVAAAPGQAAPAGPIEPMGTRDQPWVTDPKTGIDMPPVRPQLIDRVPKHPHLGETRSVR